MVRDACARQALTHSSFLLLWSAVLIMYPTSLAVISMTFSNYVLQPVFPNCIPPAAASRALSMACLSERPPWGRTMPPAPVWEDCGGVGGGASSLQPPVSSASGGGLLAPQLLQGMLPSYSLGWTRLRPTHPLSFPLSAPDMGEQLQRALGHTHPGHLHRWEAAGPVPHHWRGLRPDLPR